jgi:hypothetical protein
MRHLEWYTHIWDDRMIITNSIDLAPATSIAGQQVVVNIPFQTGYMDADFSNVTFESGTSIPLSFWIESYESEVSAKVWVKLDDINTSQFKCKWGDEIVSEPSGETTFEFFGTNSAGSTYGSGSAFMCNGILETYLGYHSLTSGSASFMLSGSNILAITRTSGSTETVDDLGDSFTGDHKWEIVRASDSCIFKIDDEQVGTTHITDLPEGALPLSLDNINWAALRLLGTTEPIARFIYDAVHIICIQGIVGDTVWEPSATISAREKLIPHSYIDGYLMPIVAYARHLNTTEFPDATVVLSGISNRVLLKTDYRGLLYDWIPFDTYSEAIFISDLNIVYVVDSTEILEANKFIYTTRKVSKTNISHRMIHHNLE